MNDMKGISKKRQIMYFFLFTGVPLLLLIMTFYLPLFSAFRLAFCKYNPLSSPKFIGLENWGKMFNDKVMWISLKNTLIYMGISTFFVTIISFVIALGLNRTIRGIGILRTCYLLPLVTSTIAILMIWHWMYNPSYGIFNTILNSLGFSSIRWLTSTKTALFSIIMFDIWSRVSYFALIFLAALQNIPKTYNEAASIDGANKFQQGIYITLPLVSPTTFFVLMITMFRTAQAFEPIFMLTEGGPGYSTHTLTYYLYRNGFFWFRMGYATSIAWFLFILLLMLTLIHFYLQKKWVYYA